MSSELLSVNILNDNTNKVTLEIELTKSCEKQDETEFTKAIKTEGKDICRLCLKPGFLKIFGDDPYCDTAHDINDILGIEITENDGKPQNICSSCETIVKSAAQLKQTAQVIQWKLQEELEWVQVSEGELSQFTPERESNQLTPEGESRQLTPEGESRPTTPVQRDNGLIKPEVKIVSQRARKRDWICKRCKQKFKFKNDLREHREEASCSLRRNEYVCEICGLKTKLLSRLKKHRLTHTDDLSYPCSSCPYRGRTKYLLAMHVRTHSGDRPLTCPDCSATFRNSSNLASHRRRHLPPRYHCDNCQKGFKFRQALQNHIATQHTDNKSFVCSDCGKAYATRKMYRRHEIEVHNCPKKTKGKTPTYIQQQDTS